MSTLRSIPILIFLLLITAVGAMAQKPSPRILDLHAPDGTLLKGTYFSSGKSGPGVLLLHQCNQQQLTPAKP